MVAPAKANCLTTTFSPITTLNGIVKPLKAYFGISFVKVRVLPNLHIWPHLCLFSTRSLTKAFWFFSLPKCFFKASREFCESFADAKAFGWIIAPSLILTLRTVILYLFAPLKAFWLTTAPFCIARLLMVAPQKTDPSASAPFCIVRLPVMVAPLKAHFSTTTFSPITTLNGIVKPLKAYFGISFVKVRVLPHSDILPHLCLFSTRCLTKAFWFFSLPKCFFKASWESSERFANIKAHGWIIAPSFILTWTLSLRASSHFVFAPWKANFSIVTLSCIVRFLVIIASLKAHSLTAAPFFIVRLPVMVAPAKTFCSTLTPSAIITLNGIVKPLKAFTGTSLFKVKIRVLPDISPHLYWFSTRCLTKAFWESSERSAPKKALELTFAPFCISRFPRIVAFSKAHCPTTALACIARLLMVAPAKANPSTFVPACILTLPVMIASWKANSSIVALPCILTLPIISAPLKAHFLIVAPSFIVRLPVMVALQKAFSSTTTFGPITTLYGIVKSTKAFTGTSLFKIRVLLDISPHLYLFKTRLTEAFWESGEMFASLKGNWLFVFLLLSIAEVPGAIVPNAVIPVNAKIVKILKKLFFKYFIKSTPFDFLFLCIC